MADISQYDPIIEAAAREWNVDPNLMRSMIWQESSGKPGAVSKVGAQGLMQVMPQTGADMGATDLTDPVQNIYAGAKYLSQALDAEKSVPQALLYYHGGPDWRKKYGPESAAYVPSVQQKYAQMVARYAAPTVQPEPAADSFTSALIAAKGGDAKTNEAASDPFTSVLTQAQKVATKAAEPPPPDGTEAAAEVGPYGDVPTGMTAQAGANIGNAVVQGAKEGFGSGPIGIDPNGATEAWLRGKGVVPPTGAGSGNLLQNFNEAVINPLAATADLGYRTAGALYRGGQALVAQTGAELGQPQLGRDLASIPDAFAGSPNALRGPELPSVRPNQLSSIPERAPEPPAALPAPVNPVLASKPPAPPFVPPGATIPTASTAADIAKMLEALPDAPPRPDFVPPGTPRPNPLAAPSGAYNPLSVAQPPEIAPVNPGSPPQIAEPPVPQSMGAAASSAAEAAMTPAQVQAYRSTAEGQKLLEPQPIGRDENAYVPGVTPNAAEIEQSVNTARELKALNVMSPEVSQEAKEIAVANNDQRMDFEKNIRGSEVTRQNAIDARDRQAEEDLAATWKNKKDADASPVIKTAQDIFDSADGRRPLIRSRVDSVTKELYKPDGSLITDPEQLYGVRKHIDDLLSKEAGVDDPLSVRAASNLLKLKASLDGVIEKAAPGFGQYLKNFSEASRPIDAMEVLQAKGGLPSIYDSQNRIQYGRMQTLMRKIVDARAAPGINPYKSITDDQMAALWALRDDLRRSAAAQDLARAPGSDTQMLGWDMARKMGTQALVHGAANYALGPGVGSIAVGSVKRAIQPFTAARAAAKQTQKGLQMLRTDPKTLRNPLSPEH